MSYPFPNTEAAQPNESPRFTRVDLLAFALFFGLTIIFLPAIGITVLQAFNPDFQIADLSGVQQVLLQGVMDVLLIGFIIFLIKVVHRLPFLETIAWHRRHRYQTGFLIALGAALALTVLMVSALFPPAEPPPIERLITSSRTLYVFVLFGVGIAPLVEEIIFRGFLFRVISDVANSSAAVVGTALLFTLLHVPQLWGSWAGIALIFVVGYALSFMRDRSQSLIPSFIVHTAYNGMLFAVYAVGTLAEQGLKS